MASRANDFDPIQGQFQKTVLSNGVRVVTESHRHTRAVSLGLFVEVGTRLEDPRQGGVTHFVEHLVFKGTRKRSAFELSRALERVGGDLNAYTTRESTCFHALCLREDAPLALDVLTDLLTNARMTAEDFVREREVIVQEIQMSRDDGEDLAVDALMSGCYAGHRLATPILGTEETLSNLTRKDLISHFERMVRGPQIVLSVAGPIEHDEIVAQAERALGSIPGKKYAWPKTTRPRVKRIREFIKRPGEQVHLLVALESSPYQSRYRFESFVVNELIGGGLTSRLYQRVREELGLVYSVYSFLQSFDDTGLFAAYAGTSAKNAARVTKALRSELRKVAEKGLRPGELKDFKTQVKGQILLGAEDVESRMNSLASNEMAFGEYRPVERVIAEIEGVTLQSMAAYVDKYFDLKRVSLMVVGDLKDSQAKQLLDIWE